MTAPDGSAGHVPSPAAPSVQPAATASTASCAPAPSSVSATAAGVEIGRVLRGRYVLESRLGSGGMGTVFKASDNFRCDLPENNRHVAIKILHQDVRSRPDVLANLRREFYCAQGLLHRNIVRVYELDQDGDVAYFTMELLDGTLLSEVIEQFHRDPHMRKYAWPIIRDIGAGLAYAHAQQVVHADLKPQNIMVTHGGEVRILDFGTSSAVNRQGVEGDSQGKAGALALTPAYASCELLDGKVPDPRDDLFALACISYELLAGKHPFDNKRASEARALGMTPQRPPGINARQWRALTIGLAWERKDRSLSIREWVAAIGPRHPRLVAWCGAFAAAALFAMLGGLWGYRASRPAPPTSSSALASPPAQVAATAAAPVAVRQAVAAPTAAAHSAAALTASTLPPPGPPKTQQVVKPAAPTAGAPAARSVAPNSGNDSGVATSTKRGARNDERSRTLAHALPEITFVASHYRVRPGGNFAEVRVKRSGGANAAASFEWWTEPGTADRDFDYLPQARIAQRIAKDGRSVSLFIKILPNPARRNPATFSVVIGSSDKGTALGPITRTVVSLPRH